MVARRHGLVEHDEVETVEQAVDPGHRGTIHRDAAGAGLMVGSVRRERLGTHLLTCEGVEASYGSLQVLFGIDVGVERNELLALLGTNGAGKSTVLKSVAGLLPAGEGQDHLRRARHHPAAGRGDRPAGPVAHARRQGRVPHAHRGREPAAGVAGCCATTPTPPGACRDETLAMFPILGERHDQLAGDLSGGEQQQLSLAMAFVTRPKLLCIDELSLGLAPTVVDRLVDKVREIHAHGTTVVVVEQSVNVALLLCQRAVFLEKGQVRFRGPTAGLLDRPDILRAVFIGADNGSAGAGASRPRRRPCRRRGSGPTPWRHPRGPRPHQALRRHPGARRRRPHDPPGHDRRA